MPRPREFDEQDVLERALNAFWARGYDATSVEDLVEATGLGRASLYGAFGDKEQLFRRSLAHYLQRNKAEADRLTANLGAREAIEAFVWLRVERATCKDNPMGCFLLISATSGTSAKLIEDSSQLALKETRGWLQKHLKQMQESSELPHSADTGVLADLLVVLINGITASAKAGVPLKTLKAVTRQGLALVLGSK